MRFLYVGRISVKSLNNFLDISLGLEVSQDQPFNLTGPQPTPLWNGMITTALRGYGEDKDEAQYETFAPCCECTLTQLFGSNLMDLILISNVPNF